MINYPYEYKINLYKLRCQCSIIKPWICNYLFTNDKMLLESTRNMTEWKKVIVDKINNQFDNIFEPFANKDLKDSIDTCDGNISFKQEINRVKECISGVRTKNVVSNHRH